MGTFINPNNEAFAQAVNSRIYVDKTGLLGILNERLGTEDKCISVSHARRFGKSQAAEMIDAYYSCGCDSRELFSGLKIETFDSYEKYLNKYNVIHLDISSLLDGHVDDFFVNLKRRLYKDISRTLSYEVDNIQDIAETINDIYEETGVKFVIIIDEWDCIIRNHSDRPDLVHGYLQLLHSIFKSRESKNFLALGYITGILPIKKIQDESALNNFREYTMIDSKELTSYFGFTQTEVEELSSEYNMSLDSVKEWYNGYIISGERMYNPNSVYQAMLNHNLEPYWKNTSSFTWINKFIAMNFEGLREDILAMLNGEEINVDVSSFKNDLSEIGTKDEVFTALIHLGYLGYRSDRGTAFIPNYEIKSAFKTVLSDSKAWGNISRLISSCDDLLKATIAGNEKQVAEMLELSHETYTSVQRYNDENSLSCAITMAYFTAPAYYTVVRELPTGKGFADIVFLPRADTTDKPAMVIELKWNKSADTAINQIKDKRYTGKLTGYCKEILLVGINYDRDTKKHECNIERVYN